MHLSFVVLLCWYDGGLGRGVGHGWWGDEPDVLLTDGTTVGITEGTAEGMAYGSNMGLVGGGLAS